MLRSPNALRRLLWSPGELGAAQAYVTNELDVEGEGLTRRLDGDTRPADPVRA